MKKNYTLTNYGEFGVIIKQNLGTSGFYPYNPIMNYMEVNVNFDYETLKIKRWKKSQEWTYRLMGHESDSLANWQSRDSAVRIFGESVIHSAEIQVKKNIKAVLTRLNYGRNNPLWLELQPIADSVIEHYKTDFYYHDALNMPVSYPLTFLWLVRSTGTWMIKNRSEWNDNIMKSELKNHRVFYCDSYGKIQEVTHAQAESIYSRMES